MAGQVGGGGEGGGGEEGEGEDGVHDYGDMVALIWLMEILSWGLACMRRSL